jgi:hypothetical protein
LPRPFDCLDGLLAPPPLYVISTASELALRDISPVLAAQALMLCLFAKRKK